jgi:Na+/H+-translocating membrane pyrophosphatase
VTVTNWVEFFLGVSVLSLIVAVIFRRQVIGSDIGTVDVQKIAGVVREGAVAFLKRPYKIATAMAGLLLPAFAYGQTEQAGRRSQPEGA